MGVPGLATPSALWLLLLVPLLWLLHRHRPRQRQPVSALFLWRSGSAPRSSSLSHRLRAHPLLWVQTAIVALLTLALAGMSWTSRPEAVVDVILDASLSMGARDGVGRRIEAARARLRTVLNTLDAGTTVRLWRASGTVASIGAFAAASPALSSAVDALVPSDGGADLQGAIRLARQAVPRSRRIYVATDHATPSRGDEVEWLEIGRPADNLAVTSLTIARDPERADGSRAMVEVRNFGATDRDVPVTIRRETRRETQRETQIVARATLHVRARGQAGFTTAISDGGGTLVATLEADDALAADNTRYAAPAARPLTRVALIGANAFLEAALQANQTVTRLEATSGVPDVVVCLGCAEAPPGDSGVLQAGEASGATIAPAPLTVVAPEHPLVRGISLDGVMARPLARRPTPDGSLPAGAVVIARAGELPAIIAIESGNRRIVETRMDLADPALALSAAYPLLMANALDWLRADDRTPGTGRAGDPVQWVFTRPPQGRVTVTGPDNAPRAVTVEGSHVTVPDTGMAGPYRISIDGETRIFIAHPPIGESDLSVAAREPESLVASAPTTSPAARSLTWLLLVITLGLFVWEARLRYRAAPTGAPALPLRRLAVRLVAGGLLIAALGGVRVWTGTAPRAAMFVVDRSDSIGATSNELLGAARTLARSLGTRDRSGLAVFGSSATVERRVQEGAWPEAPMQAQVDGSATDLERAVQTARAALPDEGDRRIVLLSDGLETVGNVRREAAGAAADGVHIDVVRPRPSSRAPAVLRLFAPPAVRIGEPFEVGVILVGPPGARGEAVLQAADGRPFRQPIRLPQNGVVTATFAQREDGAGVHVYRASFVAPEDDFGGAFPSEPNAQAGVAVTVSGEPRVLYVGAQATALAPLLASGGMRVDRASALAGRASSLADYDAVIVDDVARDAMSQDASRALATYVERGGGLVVLGSERSLTPAPSADDVYAALLPVDARPRRGERASDLALVVAFDKSGSMDDRVDGAQKIEFARQAVRSVAATLAPTDALGVIAFDAQPSVVVPLGSAPAAEQLATALRAVQPEGATAIAPALERASGWLAEGSGAAYARKHVLLVSDGRTPVEDLMRARRLVERRTFVLSVVALGAGQDRTALELLATASGGRAYFVEDVRELPATVMREASRVAGGRTVEAPFAARPSAHAILNGIDMTRPPRLGGYVVTAARSGSEVVLSSHLGDPLLAVWPRGLGRVGVYTGDLHSAWSSRLTHWGGFGQLFRQTVRWTSRRLDHPLLHAALRRVGGELVLEVEAGDDRTRPRPLDVRGTLRAPAGRSLELLFEPAGPGRYEAHAPLREQGTYLANLSAKSSDGTLDGALLRGFHWSASGEREPRDADVALLVELAAMTGGQVLEPGATALPPREPGFADGRPWLMSAALAIFLLDAVLEGVAGSLAAAWSRRLVAGPLEQSA